MQKLLTFILLLSLGITVHAKEIDITKTKGIDQEVINTLSPEPMGIETKRGKNIKLSFLEKLDPNSIDKETIQLTYLGCQTPKLEKLKAKRDSAIDQCKTKYQDHKRFKKLCIKCAKEIYKCQKEQKCHKKEIRGKVKYLKQKDILLFNPHKRLKPGFYQVKVKGLKTKEAQKIKKIVYRFEISKNSIIEVTLAPETITLTEGETIPLELTVHYQDGNSTMITEDINWIIGDESIITIDATGVLTALKSGTTLVQAEYPGKSSSQITVTVNAKAEIINGYTLPPEPDPEVNNATLLGVDSNNNGIRDDVERWIVKQFANSSKVATEVGFQMARAKQAVIENPANAENTYKIEDAAADCSFAFSVEIYAQILKLPYLPETDILTTRDFKAIQLNTRERIRAYLQYDLALSGGVYDSTPIGELKSKCSADVLEALGGE